MTGAGAAAETAALDAVFGGGHTWPGAWGNMDISASEEIWKFFSRYIE